MVTIVGQVPSEDVELAGNHPPRVPNLDLVLGGQEDSELAGGEGRRRHRWALPGPQPTQRAVRHLQERDDPIYKKKGFCNYILQFNLQVKLLYVSGCDIT